MAFERKVTQMIRKLESTNEGKQCPQIVEILKRIDKEISELKKK